MKLKQGDKLFTIYWRDGERSVMAGADIASAFSRAGYGGGATSAVDWYDNAASDTHTFSKTAKEWIQRPKRLEESDLTKLSPEQIKADLTLAHGLVFVLPTLDQIVIDVSIGEYPASSWVHRMHSEEFETGCVRCIRVYTAEYNVGPYADDGDEECYYMVGGTAWFDPQNIDQAIAYFMKLVKARVDRDAGKIGADEYLDTFATNQAFGSTSIQTLIESQSINDL